MKAQILEYWDLIRSSFWFLPVLMASAAVALAFSTVVSEGPTQEWLRERWGWSFGGGAEGASAVLATIAGSMITIAGVVFSMTLVALSLTSSQFGPRMLRSFMRDRTTQLVLGTFVSTFLYCLLVLRTVRGREEVAFVPHLSVSFGVVLAVVSVGVLIYFIHHVAVSIQANEIVARISSELLQGIDRLFPAEIGGGTRDADCPPPDGDFLERFEAGAGTVPSARDGYVRVIDGEALMALAVARDFVLRVERKPGHYVVAGHPLVLIEPRDRIDESLIESIQLAFAIGNQRTFGQDIEFAIRQLVEIALRALSPSLNDPFTAIVCLDHLSSALCRLADLEPPSPYRHDAEGRLRVIAPPTSFPGLVDAALNQIRQDGRSNVAVTIRLLETIAVVARSTKREEDRAALQRHAEMVARGAAEALSEGDDRRQVEERYHEALRKLAEPIRESTSPQQTDGDGDVDVDVDGDVDGVEPDEPDAEWPGMGQTTGRDVLAFRDPDQGRRR